MSDNIRLTRSAKRLLFLLCEHYNTRIRYGTPVDEAAVLGGARQIIGRLGLSDSPANVTAWARELSDAGLLSALFADLELVESELNPSAIIYYESRYDDLRKLLPDLLSAARSALSLIG